ncbi:hypothetical protein O4H61_11940 [Roseovarius aestuarii]|nr:hypothetical protein [Roseovarius aestuarii]
MTRLSTFIATSLALSLVAGSAFAAPNNSRDRDARDRVVYEENSRSHSSKKVSRKTVTTKTVTVQKQKSQGKRNKVGHRFSKNEVVVIQDWDRRGLRNPGKNEVYAINGDAIYLLAASTLVVKALMN